jgi:hypothetical protein
MGISRRPFIQSDFRLVQRASCIGAGKGVTGEEGIMHPKLVGGQEGRLQSLRDDTKCIRLEKW